MSPEEFEAAIRLRQILHKDKENYNQTIWQTKQYITRLTLYLSI